MPEWIAQTTDHDTGSANHKGLVRLEPGALSSDEVVTLGEVLLTDVTRTVIDCFRTLPFGDAVAIADAAVRRHLRSVPQLLEQRHREHGWLSIRQADTGLWLLDPARESSFESASSAQLWKDGIPVPEHQVTVLDEKRMFVAHTDGLWQSEGVVGEADGAGKCLGQFDEDGPSALAAARAVLAEKQREERVHRLGLEFARWAPTDTYADRVSTVRSAFSRGDGSRFRGHLVSSPLSRHTSREAVAAPMW